MNLAFLPDLFALMMLVAILLMVRRRYSDARTNGWLLGLFVTLVESLAHTFYVRDGIPQAFLHVVVVDCYLLAGLIFVWASSDSNEPQVMRIVSLALTGVPLAALATVYGLNLRSPEFYFPVLAAGLLCGVLGALVVWRDRVYALAQVVGWSAAGLLILHGMFRSAVYWAIGVVYLLAAVNFQRRLGKESTGRLAIVVGFSMWALFFFLHPWLVFHAGLSEIAAHFWNLQKLMISIGMILVLLEETASTHAYLAHHDELTGLPNRRKFSACLSMAVEKADRSRTSLALIVLDLDGFKSINDSHGHMAGDFVLREVATLLRANVRSSDTVARMGGDEFIILADGLSNDASAWRLAESVRSAVSGLVEFQGIPIPLSGSVGVAVYPDDGRDPIRLLRVADQRMYGRKKAPVSIHRIDTGRAVMPSA